MKASDIAENVQLMLGLFYNEDGEWYKSSTGRDIYENALKLAKLGVPEEVIHDCFSEIISAIKDEYGD